MPSTCRRAMAAIAAAAFFLSFPVDVPAASGAPLPGFCVPTLDHVCSVRLTSVTTDVVNGTITGRPVGDEAPITLAGQEDAYLKSVGFGPTPPETIQQWDETIDQVSNLDVDPSNPNWYGNAKTKVFLPRTLNDMATRFPNDVLVVRFTPDDTQADSFRLVSIQPTAE